MAGGVGVRARLDGRWLGPAGAAAVVAGGVADASPALRRQRIGHRLAPGRQDLLESHGQSPAASFSGSIASARRASR